MRRALGALVMALLVPVAAHAQDAAEVEEARAIVRLDGPNVTPDLQHAIEVFSRAYAARPHPAMLWNLGSAYELLGDRVRAIKCFEAYAEMSPEGAAEARERVRILRERPQPRMQR